MTVSRYLDRKATELGIATGYHDVRGAWQEAPEETKRALVAAMEGGGRPARPRREEPAEAGQCHLPAELAEGRRLWGFALQLYALRSERNWGIGDFGDLRRFVELAGRLGAAAVQLSPLHALFPWWPDHVSPYAPSSRLFLNPLYIDVEALAVSQECAAARALMASPGHGAELDRLRKADLVDYGAVAERKLHVLRLLHADFLARDLSEPPSERGAAFQAFREAEGAILADFVAFEALSARFSGSEGAWQNWPAAFRDPQSEEVRRFVNGEGARDAGFSAWLQWVALEQLSAVSALACQRGMSVGLIGDLAVGGDVSGADAWRDQALFAPDVEVGSPPDPFNEKGQVWGIVPWRPLELHARAGAPLVTLLGATMRWAGGIRMDHIIGLERQFWVPRGRPGTEGAYVAFPLDELLAALAAESRRQRCLVIGEDVGTVPEGFRDRMAAVKALSTRILYFERDSTGAFRRPRDYPHLSSVVASTHDLPTVAGFLAGYDLDVRMALRHYEEPDAERAARARRRDDLEGLIGVLQSEGLLARQAAPSAPPDAAAFCRAVHGFLARASSALALVQPEDVLAATAQANLPGTTDEHPNWRRKLPVTVEAMAGDRRFDDLAEVMAERTGRG